MTREDNIIVFVRVKNDTLLYPVPTQPGKSLKEWCKYLCNGRFLLLVKSKIFSLHHQYF